MLYVAYFDKEPIDVKAKGVDILQLPISSAEGSRSVDRMIHTSLVYIQLPNEMGPFLVPFGEYDEWSLRDRYNEALRIMNTLGAAEIRCETFHEVAKKGGGHLDVHWPGHHEADVELVQEKVANSDFDFKHRGAGAAPRDPRPLRWPDEPGFTAAVMAVLEASAYEVEFNIRSESTHAVDGTLAAKFNGCGFALGGGTERSGTTTLHMRATFPKSQ